MSNKISALSKCPDSHPGSANKPLAIMDSPLPLWSIQASWTRVLQDQRKSWPAMVRERKDLCPVDAPFTRALVDVSALNTHIKHADVRNGCGTSSSWEARNKEWQPNVVDEAVASGVIAYPAPIILQQWFAFLLWSTPSFVEPQ